MLPNIFSTVDDLTPFYIYSLTDSSVDSLEQVVGIMALNWFESYLIDQFVFVRVNNDCFSYTRDSCGVLQGSVFLMFIGNIIRKQSQLYLKLIK